MNAKALYGLLGLVLMSCERFDSGIKIEEVEALPIKLEEVTTTGLELSNVRFHPTDPDVMFLIAINGEVYWHNLSSGETTSFIVVRDFRRLRQLFDMVIHPEFESNGLLAFSYTYRNDIDSITSAVSRVKVNPGALMGDPVIIEEEQLLFDWIQFNVFDHTVDALEFGPKDGYLYISTGDGGCCNDPLNEAQNLMSFRGKILRIDLDDSDKGYSIPSNNPFIDDSAALDEIWSYGLRNPFTINFDPPTGNLFIYDVGENNREEVSFQSGNSLGGANYGWKVFEGSRCNDGSNCNKLKNVVIPPIIDLKHGTSNSIIGGAYYRGSAVPDLANKLIFGDFIYKRLWALDFNEITLEVNSIWDLTTVLNYDSGDFPDLGLVRIRQDLQGEVHLVDYGGKIYKIVPTSN